MRVLLTSPESDELTHYLRVWTDEVLRECKNKNNKYFHLKRSRVTRKNVSSILGKRGVDLALFCGHGEDDQVYGNDENEVILDKRNAWLLKGKTAYAFSCRSAKRLGKEAVKNGANAYIGYKEDFIAFMDDANGMSKPLEDEIASLFLRPAFAVSKALLSEKSPDEAVSLARKEFDKSISMAINSEVQSDADQFINWLRWDRDNLVACTK